MEQDLKNKIEQEPSDATVRIDSDISNNNFLTKVVKIGESLTQEYGNDKSKVLIIIAADRIGTEGCQQVTMLNGTPICMTNAILAGITQKETKHIYEILESMIRIKNAAFR